VHCGDATAMPFPDRSFSSAVCFTVLHHVPSTGLQNRLFSEVYRVLRPGGTFAGMDSMNSPLMQVFHFRDTLVLVDPMNCQRGWNRSDSAMWKSKSAPADFGFVRSGRRNAIGIGSMRSPQAAKIRV